MSRMRIRNAHAIAHPEKVSSPQISIWSRGTLRKMIFAHRHAHHVSRYSATAKSCQIVILAGGELPQPAGLPIWRSPMPKCSEWICGEASYPLARTFFCIEQTPRSYSF